ncbi:MAG: hypothetical protein K8T10_17905 [Candidatus Eremiobacteraeota bacterium]|nr:hypothetical protein [Candidatus Eremiobacteraeota bacterium]
MKLAIAYNKEITNIVKTMGKALRDEGFDVDLFEIKEAEKTDTFHSGLFSSSKLIIIGLGQTSRSGGIPMEFEEFINNSPFIGGKQIAVFVTKKVNRASTSLKHLMKIVEENGGFLFDFEIIGNEESAEKFALRLSSIRDTI